MGKKQKKKRRSKHHAVIATAVEQYRLLYVYGSGTERQGTASARRHRLSGSETTTARLAEQDSEKLAARHSCCRRPRRSLLATWTVPAREYSKVYLLVFENLVTTRPFERWRTCRDQSSIRAHYDRRLWPHPCSCKQFPKRVAGLLVAGLLCWDPCRTASTMPASVRAMPYKPGAVRAVSTCTDSRRRARARAPVHTCSPATAAQLPKT